jgi:hypothetical protein
MKMKMKITTPENAPNPSIELARLVGIIDYRLARMEAHLSAIRKGSRL